LIAPPELQSCDAGQKSPVGSQMSSLCYLRCYLRHQC
jgi:hypothetical protein